RNANRAAHRSPKIVTPGGTLQAGVRLRGVKNLVDAVIEESAVILVGPRLHCVIDDSASHGAEFSGIVAGLDRGFLNRIHAGLSQVREDLESAAGHARWHAFHHRGAGTIRGAVYYDRDVD